MIALIDQYNGVDAYWAHLLPPVYVMSLLVSSFTRMHGQLMVTWLSLQMELGRVSGTNASALAVKRFRRWCRAVRLAIWVDQSICTPLTRLTLLVGIARLLVTIISTCLRLLGSGRGGAKLLVDDPEFGDLQLFLCHCDVVIVLYLLDGFFKWTVRIMREW
jgi:hypothetical protein